MQKEMKTAIILVAISTLFSAPSFGYWCYEVYPILVNQKILSQGPCEGIFPKTAEFNENGFVANGWTGGYTSTATVLSTYVFSHHNRCSGITYFTHPESIVEFKTSEFPIINPNLKDMDKTPSYAAKPRMTDEEVIQAMADALGRCQNPDTR